MRRMVERYTGHVEREYPSEFYAYTGLFINRHDTFPYQTDDGSYFRVRRPLTDGIVYDHLRGRITLGAYALSEQNTCKWIAFDADNDEAFRELMGLAHQVPGLLERSRRGGHLWLFFEYPVEGWKARAFGKHLIGGMELYPKQDESQGPGSLVRLPLGVHRLTQERYPLIDQEGNPLSQSLYGQLQALYFVPKIRLSQVEAAAGEKPKPREFKPQFTADAFDFISQYVELNRSGRGYCPFHDDRHMSFSVNRKGNYWNCFAGCGGGDVIAFWAKWKGITYREAAHELRTEMSLPPSR